MIYPIPAETGFEMRRKIFPPMVFLPVLWYRFRVLSLPASLKPLRLASNRILGVSHTSGMTSAVLFTVYSICAQMAMAFPINLPVCRGRSREKDNAPSLHPAPSEHTPRAYYTAASPALPAVPGCCRTHPRRRCSRWQEWCMTFANVAMAKPL